VQIADDALPVEKVGVLPQVGLARGGQRCQPGIAAGSRARLDKPQVSGYVVDDLRPCYGAVPGNDGLRPERPDDLLEDPDGTGHGSLREERCAAVEQHVAAEQQPALG
jgi:hypothetical protein